jgi:HK97 family phage major capsid protein
MPRQAKKKQNLTRTVKMQGPQLRALQFDRATIDNDARTVEMSFSSETREVVRWFGIEVLGHGPDEVRLQRINASGPLLMDHNTRDQVGVVEKAWIDEESRKGRALVRLGKSARAREIWDDIVDGIRPNVSLSYDVHRFILEEEGKNGQPDVLRAVDWEPLEISIVSVPADISVGVGRGLEYSEARDVPVTVNQSTEKRSQTMKRCHACGHEHESDTCPRCHGRGLEPQQPAAPTVNLEQERANERQRITNIQAVARAFGDRIDGMDELSRQFIDNGRGVEAFQSAVLEKMRSNVKAPNLPEPPDVQLNEREDRDYSVRNAILMALGERNDGIEMDIHREIEKKLGRSSDGIFVPLSLRSRGARAATAADTLTAAAGGAAVDTALMPLIEILRNKMMTRALGARVLSGLQGNLSFPKQIASAALSWMAENSGTNVSESDLSNFLGQVAMSPKSAQATTSVSRQLLTQASEDVEQLIRDDLAAINALGLDLAAINGSGADNQPRGILNTTGIGDVAGGDNGAAPTWDHIVGLETAVAVDNADIGNLAYLTNAKVRGTLKTTEKASGTAQFIWEKGTGGFGEMNGYRAAASNQVPSNLDKGTSTGVASAIIYGNWNDLMIGEWGVIEIIADPYTLKKQGLIELTSFMMADVAVRRAESFAAMKDALTG